MRAGIRATVYALLAMTLFSREHKELCFCHPHMVTLRADFGWKNVPQADPEGVCVYFYPGEGEPSIRFDFAGKDGGSVEIKEGKYRILCYSNDTESLLFRGMEGSDTHEGYMRDGDVFESTYGNGTYYVPPAKGPEDERVVTCPDTM